MTVGEEALREALRRRHEAGQTISGLPKPIWPEPPLDLRSLNVAPGVLVFRQERPQGPLQALVGPRIDVLDCVDVDRYDETDHEYLARVAAWPVLPLQNAVFEVDSVTGVATALRLLLSERLPGMDWWVPKHWEGPLRKYGILHNSLPAPPNPATGEAMAIEIFGTAERAIHPGSDEGAELNMAYIAWYRSGARDEDQPIAVRFPTRVVIEVATYANVQYPGIGVPLYL